MTTRFQPRSVDEGLEAGLLQLPNGTQLVFDERAMREGQLGEWGVRNLQALTTLLSEGKLGYVYPFSSFSFDVDLNILALSVGKTLLPVRLTLLSAAELSDPLRRVGRARQLDLGFGAALDQHPQRLARPDPARQGGRLRGLRAHREGLSCARRRH